MGDIPRIRPQDLRDARELLDELFAEVRAEESTLAGGVKLGIGGNTLQALRDSRVVLGNPADNLIRLDEDLFRKLGVELTEIRRRQMHTSFDFYYMTLAVSLQPRPGVQFARLECCLTFGPRGPGEPVVQTMFPAGAWRELLRLGGGVKLGLNGDLEWEAETTLPDDLKEQLPVDLRASVHGEGGLKAFVAIPTFSYRLGRAEIVAEGVGGAECFWRMEDASVQESQTVQLAIVFKVPKRTRSVHITGLAVAEPSFRWLAANLRDVFDNLKDKLKAIFRRDPAQRRGAERLPVGDHEEWVLPLRG